MLPVSATRFQIESFVGAHPLLLGMTEQEVVSTIGVPRVRCTNYLGDISLSYYEPGLDLNVGIDQHTGFAIHFGFGKLTSVEFRGHFFFSAPEAWRDVVRLSVDAHEWLGFLILRDLGITLTGFHDDDDSQLAVCVFPVGAYDAHQDQLRPFTLK